MSDKKKFDLSASNIWSLTEEEMAAAGWTAQEQERPKKPEETPRPKGPVRPSTVVKSPWDPTRESVNETVDELQEGDLSFWLGNTRPDGEPVRRPLPKTLVFSCVGLLLGVLVDLAAGQLPAAPMVGFGAGLLLSFLAGRKKP